jgi:hypothetical protein
MGVVAEGFEDEVWGEKFLGERVLGEIAEDIEGWRLGDGEVWLETSG